MPEKHSDDDVTTVPEFLEIHDYMRFIEAITGSSCDFCGENYESCGEKVNFYVCRSEGRTEIYQMCEFCNTTDMIMNSLPQEDADRIIEKALEYQTSYQTANEALLDQLAKPRPT